MKQISVRGFEPDLLKALTDLAQREGVSLNQAALRLMRKGAGLDRPGQPSLVGQFHRHGEQILSSSKAFRHERQKQSL